MLEGSDVLVEEFLDGVVEGDVFFVFLGFFGGHGLEFDKDCGIGGGCSCSCLLDRLSGRHDF